MAIQIKKLFQLLIPRKTQEPVSQPDYGTDMRAIEMWAQQILGAIETIAANAGTGGGGGGYASLTGPGQTTSPGQLVQSGDLFVTNGNFSSANFNTSWSGNTTNAGITQWSGFACVSYSTTTDFEIIGTTSNLFFVGQNHIFGTPTATGTAGTYLQVATGTTGLRIDLGGNISGTQDQSKCFINCDTTRLGNPSYASVNTNTAIGSYSTSPGTINIVAPTVSLGVLANSIVTIGQTNSRLAFFNHVGPTAQQTVTGSRGGNLALASLLSALDALGLIVDGTTP